MKRSYELDSLDCAVCAARLEDAVRKLDGVTDVKVNFITQRLTLEAEDSVFDQVLERTLKTVRKVEPDCRVLV